MTTARKLFALLAALTLGGSLAAAPASATPTLPVHRHADYLALGDSVPFGYRESTSIPTPDYLDQASFVGFPEDVAGDLSLHVANASCPGETTASFLDVTAPSNGCENGYRLLYPLHVTYSGSQLDYALDFLRHDPRTRLVSLMIGANDGFLCEKTTADQCASELPGVLQSVAAKVATILGSIRAAGHYAGQIVLVTYYSLNYADAQQTALSIALNTALEAAAAPFDVEIADGFTAFETVAAQDGGDSCAAGLLTVLSGGGCGIHPSALGQSVLAGAVEAAVRAVPPAGTART